MFDPINHGSNFLSALLRLPLFYIRNFYSLLRDEHQIQFQTKKAVISPSKNLKINIALNMEYFHHSKLKIGKWLFPRKIFFNNNREIKHLNDFFNYNGHNLLQKQKTRHRGVLIIMKKNFVNVWEMYWQHNTYFWANKMALIDIIFGPRL